jgi:enoyl-[acyl-carrier protein] reductase II
MFWLATAELAASVSNAGALGVLSPYAGMEEGGDPLQNFRRQIDHTRKLTNKPFGVNIPLDLPASGLLMDVLLQENVGIAVTSAGDPALYTRLLRSAAIRIVHVISSVSQAKNAEASGVDAVIAEGFEAGGRIGHDELSLFSLLPQVVDTVSVPVIAAGGIVDGRGLAAAFALGAGGVQLGTRFIAVEESCAHHNYKQAIVDAGDADTVVTRRSFVPTRSLKSGFSLELAALEKAGTAPENLRRHIGRGRARKAQIEGDLKDGDAYAGSSVGLVKEILPAAAVIENLIKTYNRINLPKLNPARRL